MLSIFDAEELSKEYLDDMNRLYGYEVNNRGEKLFCCWSSSREAKKHFDFLTAVSKKKISSLDEVWEVFDIDDPNADFGEVFEYSPDMYVPDVEAYLDLEIDPTLFFTLNYGDPIKLFIKDL